MGASKALVSPRVCSGSAEHLLFDNVICTKAGSHVFIQKQKILGIQERHVASLLNLLYRIFCSFIWKIFAPSNFCDIMLLVVKREN